MQPSATAQSVSKKSKGNSTTSMWCEMYSIVLFPPPVHDLLAALSHSQTDEVLSDEAVTVFHFDFWGLCVICRYFLLSEHLMKTLVFCHPLNYNALCFYRLSDFCHQPGRTSSPPAVGRCCQAWWRRGRGEDECRDEWEGMRRHTSPKILQCYFLLLMWSIGWHPRLILFSLLNEGEPDRYGIWYQF